MPHLSRGLALTLAKIYKKKRFFNSNAFRRNATRAASAAAAGLGPAACVRTGYGRVRIRPNWGGGPGGLPRGWGFIYVHPMRNPRFGGFGDISGNFNWVTQKLLTICEWFWKKCNPADERAVPRACMWSQYLLTGFTRKCVGLIQLRLTPLTNYRDRELCSKAGIGTDSTNEPSRLKNCINPFFSSAVNW